MCGGISVMGLFMVTAGLAAVYGITTFRPKLSLQNKIKAMKAKMKELMLAHNNQIIS
jgi:NAD-dependent SIR2 family protein deacetylase